MFRLGGAGNVGALALQLARAEGISMIANALPEDAKYV